MTSASPGGGGPELPLGDGGYGGVQPCVLIVRSPEGVALPAGERPTVAVISALRYKPL